MTGREQHPWGQGLGQEDKGGDDGADTVLGCAAGEKHGEGPQLQHGGDQQPPLPPPLRAGMEGPKSQLCISRVQSPPKPGPL